MPAQSTEKQQTQDAAEPARALGLTLVHSPDARLAGGHHRVDRALILGRLGGAELDLAIDDGKMSRRHARVARSGDALLVDDLGSTNGTSVDGSRIGGRTTLVEGSVLRLGNSLFVVEAGEGAAITDEGLVGRAPAFAAAVRELDRVAPTEIPVLLLGETGTGKEVFAARLHRRSGRTGRLVPVNCAAIPRELAEAALFGHRRGAFTGAERDAPGHFAEADGGTLFLDEVGELPLELQAKLLRAVEARELAPVGGGAVRPLDVRLVCATNADLAARVEEGGFRRDLFARLAGFTVALPPLRARRGDVALLVERFVDDKAGLSADFLEPLLVHGWPMNVRELRATVTRALLGAEGTTLSAAQARAALGLPPPVARAAAPEPAAAPAGSAERDEGPPREELEGVLARAGGNVAQVAAHYGKDRKQVYRWLRRYGLAPGSYRP